MLPNCNGDVRDLRDTEALLVVDDVDKNDVTTKNVKTNTKDMILVPSWKALLLIVFGNVIATFLVVSIKDFSPPFSFHRVETDSPTESPTESSTSIPLSNAKIMNVKHEGSLKGDTYKLLQTESFKRGNALIVNVHITHHAGTTICHMMSNTMETPDFACTISKNETGEQFTLHKRDSLREHPWSHQFTGVNVELVLPFYQFVTWDYTEEYPALQETNWEYDHLVSMIIMKHPIDRFLSGGKCGDRPDFERFQQLIPGDPTNETQDIYWEYANSDCADNYALRVLSNSSTCVDGANTSLQCLEGAKELLKRFTFILDAACLTESMKALSEKLDLDLDMNQIADFNSYRTKDSARVRIGNDTLYEYLENRFKRDIELYEWSKSRSVVQC